MANNYSDTTGVLTFQDNAKATPVISALFNAFDLDTDFPGGTQAYIARISESNSTRWSDIAESITEQLEDIGVQPLEPDDEEPMDIEDLLELLAEKFGCTDQVEEILERIDEDDEADLGDLFELAMLFDDGHGLKSVSVETGWHCSKPRLFEFGGAGEHFSKHLRYAATSSGVCRVASGVDAWMQHGNICEAAKNIADHALRICGGIQTPELLTAAKAAIAQAVANPAGTALDLQGRAFDLVVGIGSTGDAIDYPLWMNTRLDQDLVDLVAGHTELLRQHRLCEVESWANPLWEGDARMTGDALNVSDSGFWWSAYPKYGDHMVETGRVDFATLASAIAEAVAAGRDTVNLGLDEETLADAIEALKANAQVS